MFLVLAIGNQKIPTDLAHFSTLWRRNYYLAKTDYTSLLSSTQKHVYKEQIIHLQLFYKGRSSSYPLVKKADLFHTSEERNEIGNNQLQES